MGLLLTDEAGRFRFGGLPSGEPLILAAIAPGHVASFSEGLRVHPEGLSGDGGQTEIRLTLETAGSIEVQLSVPGMRADFMRACEVTASAVDGSVLDGSRSLGPDGEGRVVFESLTPGEWTVQASRFTGHEAESELRTVNVASGGRVRLSLAVSE